MVGSSSLYDYDNLYLLDIITSFNESLYVNLTGNKCKLTDQNSTLLWHMRSGHITKRRVERIVSGGILSPIDFSNFVVCVDYIKVKQTNIKRFGANKK